jgi:hypothetical protein
MNRINKRLEKLETRVAPLGKNVLIIIHKDESEERAMARKGLTSKDLEEAASVIWVRLV